MQEVYAYIGKQTKNTKAGDIKWFIQNTKLEINQSGMLEKWSLLVYRLKRWRTDKKKNGSRRRSEWKWGRSENVLENGFCWIKAWIKKKGNKALKGQ